MQHREYNPDPAAPAVVLLPQRRTTKREWRRLRSMFRKLDGVARPTVKAVLPRVNSRASRRALRVSAVRSTAAPPGEARPRPGADLVAALEGVAA